MSEGGHLTPHGVETKPPTVLQDDEFEGILLVYLLAEAPRSVTADELIQLVVNDPGDFTERDGFRRAIHRLCAHGLVRQAGGLILPTVAGQRAWTLLAD